MFVAARAIRSAERSHEYHQVLHDFAEQTERLLTVLLLVLFGGAVVGGLLAPLTWPAALAGLSLIFVVRPLSYVVAHIDLPRADLLWATVGFVVLVSVVVHGVAATPVMRLLDRTNERTEPTQSVTETP